MQRGALLIGLMAAIATAPASAGPKPAPRLTADGWGALRVGMPEADAIRRFHLRIEQADSEECHALWSGDERLMVLTAYGKVASVAVYRRPQVLTDRGLHIGSTEAEVRRAYGPALEIQPNHYDDPPAHYLTWWAKKGERGIMYETDPKGRVSGIHAGDETIGWTDGCG